MALSLSQFILIMVFDIPRSFRRPFSHIPSLIGSDKAINWGFVDESATTVCREAFQFRKFPPYKKT